MQYPSQNGKYKVKIKEASKNWKDFNTAAFDISVGMPNHEGDKLKDALDWGKGRFDNVIINCNDSLQRFNIIFEQGVTEKEAMDISIKHGTEWLNRNSTELSDCTIYRWEEWRNHHDFSALRNRAEILYKNNNTFHSEINNQMENIWQRRYEGKPEYKDNKEEFKRLSREYLLEETAIFAIMNKKQYDVHIYPGTFLQVLHSFEGTNDMPGLEEFNHIRIDFSRNKNFNR